MEVVYSWIQITTQLGTLGFVICILSETPPHPAIDCITWNLLDGLSQSKKRNWQWSSSIVSTEVSFAHMIITRFGEYLHVWIIVNAEIIIPL